MYAVGHLALGYLASRGISKITKTDVSLPIVFALSILPDIDLVLLPTLHRGPTQSVILMTVLAIPFLIKFRRIVLPYFAALLQHSLAGDMIVGTNQTLWPLSKQWYGLDIVMGSTIELAIEWGLFLTCISLMLKLGDLRKLMDSGPLSLILVLPGATVGTPLIVRWLNAYPLIPAEVFYLACFTLSILLFLKKRWSRWAKSNRIEKRSVMKLEK